MTQIRSFLTVAMLFSSACGGHSSPPVPVAFEPCEVPGTESPDSMGRVVRGSGFAFASPTRGGQADGRAIAWTPNSGGDVGLGSYGA